MFIIELTISLLLLLIGTVIIIYLVTVLYFEISKLFGDQKLFRSNWHLKQGAKKIAKADGYIFKHEHEKAINELRSAVIFYSPTSLNQINQLKQHHQGLLGRYLIIAEETNSHIDNIGKLEDLYIQRAELQQLFLKVSSAYANLAEKRTAAGKITPNWSKGEYGVRIKQIEKQLKENRLLLEKELLQMLRMFSEQKSRSMLH